MWPPRPPINVGNVHPVAWARFPVLLCNIDWGAGGPPKVAILETGRDTTFGALLKTFGARNISGFVARLPIWWPWAPSARRMLQEAFKTGFPDLG